MATDHQATSPSRTATDRTAPADPATADADAYTPRTLASKLQAAFTTMPSEPGYNHPEVDRIIATLPPTDANIAALTAVAGNLNGNNPHLAYDTLVRIAHTSPDWPTEAKVSVVSRSLESNEPMVRDGTIQVVEAWADQAMLQLLQEHHETNDRIAAYVSEVTTDITVSLSLRDTQDLHKRMGASLGHRNRRGLHLSPLGTDSSLRTGHRTTPALTTRPNGRDQNGNRSMPSQFQSARFRTGLQSYPATHPQSSVRNRQTYGDSCRMGVPLVRLDQSRLARIISLSPRGNATSQTSTPVCSSIPG